MFIAVLFMIGKKYNKTNCQSTDKFIKKMWLEIHNDVLLNCIKI